jgi:hypothetical protein
MRLVRFDSDKTGLVVELSTGPHVIDVVASIAALVPEDPISQGVLNGLLKDNGGWAPLINHWNMARRGLRRLAVLARTAGSSQIVLRRLDQVKIPTVRPDAIGSLEIEDCDAVAQDPTGREVMECQFAAASQDPAGQAAMISQPSDVSTEAVPTDGRIVLLSSARTAR